MYKLLITSKLTNMTQTKQISSYEKRAIDFLNATSTSIISKWKEYSQHFADDKVNRHIFRVTIKNKLGSYTFSFGQSIAQDATPPTAYDILTCLQKSDVGSFDDFCSEFGYDTDSKKAEKIYKAVCEEYTNLCRLFSHEQLENMQEIQ